MIIVASVAATSLEQVAALIEKRHQELGRPIAVGVSGYAGSDTSTVVRDIDAAA